MSDKQSIYEFKERAGHSAPVIGESLYLWGGEQFDFPYVHDSPRKRKLFSTVETFSFSSARWSSHLTRGTPPLGVVDYSCTTFRSNIYYYAGWCGHDHCHYNSLTVLNTLTMSWTQLHPNDESMMEKSRAGMLSLEFDGTDYLLMVGGLGPTPAVKHPQFQYEQIPDGRVRTNEQLLYNLSNRQFTVPSVSGQCCPPTSTFTINKINQNKGIMFGRTLSHVGGFDTFNTNKVYIFNVTHNTIHWESIKKGSIFVGGLQLKGRCAHASAIISGDSTLPALVVIGGWDENNQSVNECLLFDNITTGQFSCKKIPLPESVTGRYAHSLTAVTMSPHCVWLVIVGGCEESQYVDFKIRVKVPTNTFITDTNRQIMIIELVYSEAGEWMVQSVLDGNDLTSKKYQEKYSSYNKTKTWWMNQLMEYPTEKEMELQRYNQLLQEKLRVFYQDKVSLQEALVEANKQEVLKAQVQSIQEEKQIITEDNEKLRATVAYNEVYITEIEEEKKQVEEEKRKVEDKYKQAKKEKKQAEEEKRQLEEQYLIDKQTTKELKAKVAVNDVYITELEEENEKVEKQYHKEKEITKELKAKVAENELYTAKLMKEKEQWSQVKETDSIGLQFNYLIPSMDNLDCLSDVQVAEKKLFLIQGDKPQLMNWEKYGVRIGVEEGSLLSSETVEAAVVALVGGQFQFPPNTVLVSAVYAVSLSKPLLKRLKLEIQHCVDLTGRPALNRYLKFAIAPVSTPSLPYQFSTVEGGEFSSKGGYGFIERKDFCLVCILGLLIVSMTGGGGKGGGGGGNQQQQGAGVVPAAQQQQGGDALTVLVQQQQPGVNQQTQEQQGEQSQEGQEEEGELQGGNQQGERQSQEQSELPEQQQQEGGQHEAEGGHQEGDRGQEEGHKDDPVHIETATDAVPCTESSSDYANSVVYTNVQKSMKYAGLVYYEEKGVEDLVTFTAAKKLEALIQYIERKHSQAEIGPDIFFRFKFSYGYIELNLTAQQDEPFTGWTVKPHTEPCRLYQEAIDNFGDKEHSRPSCCLISVYGSPHATPTLHYSIPLEGVADPVTLNIHRALRNRPPSTVHESVSVSSTGGASPSATVDVDKVKKVIDDVLVSNHARLNHLKTSLSDLANQLYEVGLINDEVREACSMDKFIGEFKASFYFMDELSEVQDHCKKFLNSFIAVRGSYINAAKFLRQKWIEAIKTELGIDLIIDVSV
ncbi:PREDICTED: uncharacterized protein LOC100637873 isoform X1 [Amphimedon queenslandica]|uniref:Uncharacterized protein n=1 Tax=Amphimedon queenslandica TaxID=400682 RepID=A0AAN0IXS5_AMPQE|nr:PREDICTED: uncharacterized protein LOC100637873 isoform X1 [Amphimedon queenslandica]|eukprot:XP_019849570.1 PREDICTED: uncharacterized protein LOC100637873 isoform X1 [Amphimedon queenslandica]